ncbi:hypothetical protein AX17_004393 [Amanita inopinata Kibby_2008]|nr:hypothetical protein AX17_004393 [Amanita inopinata Kibby_2008]
MFFQQLLTLTASRQFQARFLSTVICAILVVLRPVSKLGGPSAFLALTVKELVFSVQENLAQQLEATFLHLAGGFAGIGLSTLGNYISSLPEPNGVTARMTPALFLVTVCFIAGWLKSRLPRLTKACRIACFLSIWLLTENIGHEKHILQTAGQYMWITTAAALTSLTSSMLLLQWSSTQLARDIARAIGLLHISLQYRLQESFPDSVRAAAITPSFNIHKALLGQTMALHPVYQQASFELRIGRVGVKSLKPLVAIVEHLRRELSGRITFPAQSATDTPYESRVIQNAYSPSLELGRAIVTSLKTVETMVLICFERPFPAHSLRTERDSLHDSSTHLVRTVSVVHEELGKICNDLILQQQTVNESGDFPDKVLDLCSFMTSLLQTAYDVKHALNVAHDVVNTYEASPLKLWHPRLTVAWLGVAASPVVLDEPILFLEEEGLEPPTNLTLQETIHGIAERRNSTNHIHGGEKLSHRRILLHDKLFFPQWWRCIFYYLWNHTWTMRTRLSLSRILRSIQHSPHLKHAVKNAAGVSILGVAAFLPETTSARHWFESVIAQWMLISYVWVLETNTGATFRVGYLRLSGTLAGALYAFIGSLVCHGNPYGLVIICAIAEFPISWIIMKTTFPSFGTVASVTLPPVLFLPYFRPGTEIATWRLAVFRSALNAAGIVAALMMNSLLFPRHCRVMFLNSACRTLGLFNQLYIGISREFFHHTQSSATMNKRRILKLEADIRKVLYRMSVLLITMNDELSLIPKPVQKYKQLESVLHKLSDIFTGLRKIRDNINKKDITFAVTTQRREFASCICISLFASEQVFRTRQPLPQFLPSSKLALRALEKAVETSIENLRLGDSDSPDLSLIYIFAELDVLTNLVDTMDELLDLNRELFGKSNWCNLSMSSPFISMHEEMAAGLTVT